MKITFRGFDTGEYARRETLFHVANGYVGMRASFEEGVDDRVRSIRGTYLNGFYDSAPIHYEEKLHGFASTQQSIVNVVDTQGIGLRLAGERFSCQKGTVEDFEQELDMDLGVYTRRLTWVSPKGLRSRLVFRRLASFTQQELVLLEVSLTPLNWSGGVEMVSGQNGEVVQDFDPHDPRKASVGKKTLDIQSVSPLAGGGLLLAGTSQSGLKMASAVGHRGPEGFTMAVETGPARCEVRFTGQATEGRALNLSKYCVFTDSRRVQDPAARALLVLEQALALPFAAWVDRQAAYLALFWQGAHAEVLGDEALNASLRWSMYTLLASAGKDGIGNIASKGLSGEGYEGHYFWDTEIYMFPFFLLTNPGLARKLLESRAAMLEEAFAHAREMGHQKGALYAWRTITGSECSAYFPSGSAQYHINGAVAHAFLSYFQATGDRDFMAKSGARVLIETARLWLDAGHSYEGRFRIDAVTGPDEYSCVVNNNYYTNRLAQFHLQGTVSLLESLAASGMLDGVRAQTGVTAEELRAFQKAADTMYLPFDQTLSICAQDDDFLKKKRLDLRAIPRENYPLLMHYHPLFLYRHQVCKQADTVLAHFLFEEGEDEAVIRSTYDYYEGITTHDSSLSACVFAMMAARTGQLEKADAYYRDSAVLDLEDTHKNTQDGIHAANMGGCYMGIVYGFAGLRLHRDGLSFRPALPNSMAGYRFTLAWQGSRLLVETGGGQAVFTLLEGPALPITVYGKHYQLADRLVLPLNTPAS